MPSMYKLTSETFTRSTAAAVVSLGLILTSCAGDDDPTGAAAAEEAAEEGVADDAGEDGAPPESAVDDDPSVGDVAAGDAGSAAVADGVGLFDASVVHDVELTFEQDDYDAMIATLAETGDKEWIEVTVTIDGVTYERAGARLKGNSSLAGLSGAGPGRGGGAGAGAGGIGGGVSADEPAGLPWLIRLDHFVEGQQHDGYVDLVIRSNNTSTSLNESVALDLLGEAGLASQDAAPVSFSVNGGAATLRLMIEHPSDDAWQEANFDGSGALYKAESTGDWSYRGDDPADYEDVFDQEGGSKITDLSPLIEFLEFLNESDDETFAAELPERLDVDAFATYLAMMELVQNFDDIDGPGNNAYLWWDAESGQFTVVPWDLNLAFGSGGFGGPGGGFEPPEGFEPPARGADGELPDGFEPPEGFEPPDGALGDPPEGFEPGGRGGFGGFGRSNPLVERFLANADFGALYEQQLEELTAELIDSGDAERVLETLTDALTEQATDLVDTDTIAQESASIAEALSGT